MMAEMGVEDRPTCSPPAVRCVAPRPPVCRLSPGLVRDDPEARESQATRVCRRVGDIAWVVVTAG